ncbi:MAG: trigger factor [Proteobacteria bacterium]|nr:trigger factor [Pseudomonadota bacterium]
MQVTIEDVSSVKKILHIEVPEETVQSEIDSAYQSLKKTAKIKGFRPGKAPRSVLERMFKKDVHADVVSKLIQNSLIEAIQSNNLNVVGDPIMDPPHLEENKVYKFDTTVEIKPELPAVDFKGLQLKKSKYVVSEEEIDTQIQMLRRNIAKYDEIEEKRPAKQGDITLIDYEGFKDGNPFEHTPRVENQSMRIGSGRIIAEFDNQIVGMSIGDEKIFEITFPEDYFNTNFSGNTILYKVVLRSIREESLPDLNNDFAKQFGPYETLDALKQEIQNNLTKGYEKRIEQELNEQIFQQLIEKMDFEIPDTMVDYELEGILDEAERSFHANNVTLEQIGQTRESLAQKYRGVAEKQVRRHLILDSIITHEKLAISEDELEKGFQDLADNFNQTVAGIKAFYKENPEKIEFFKYTLLEKKAIKLIMETGNIEEKEPELQTNEGESKE